MYTVGNELPFANSTNGTALVAIVNQLISFARNYQTTKWNRAIPFTSAIIDTPRYYDWLVTCTLKKKYRTCRVLTFYF